ncbi:hypothetical protein [Nocardia vaccinii]|uniref:hypothetical protein n=1 Tax=Nocardia vaccinii TaxID=1822 RepID=UPI000ACD7E7E|nr:hypothetical protein [Nocardia vaccinii]
MDSPGPEASRPAARTPIVGYRGIDARLDVLYCSAGLAHDDADTVRRHAIASQT